MFQGMGKKFFALLMLAGCSEASNKLVPWEPYKPVEVPKPIESEFMDVNFTLSSGLDILFVIDDSGSMSAHQSNLVKNIELLTSGFMGSSMLDYHIGVISSDIVASSKSGRLQGMTKYVDRNTRDGINVLRSNLLVGTNGHFDEEFFEPVRRALTPPLVDGYNKGFYRPDAHLAIVFLTDTDDQGDMSATQMYNFLLSLKGGNKDKVISYGVIVPTNDRTGCARDSIEPQKIEALLNITNQGQVNWFGLCDPDYGVQLSDMGKDLFKRVTTFLPLTRRPVLNTIEVQFGPYIIEQHPIKGWTYDPRRVGLSFGPDIQFPAPPPVGSKLGVRFTPAEDAISKKLR